ncbi:MAG TPA: hypothetical protein HPP94_07695 [Desulfuromonadales bacterium]|nr:hypothetical protein [Desulfuromonadales bacterium]
MKRSIFNLIALLALAAPACASDSIAVGVRGGVAVAEKSFSTEVFGDLYLNRLLSVGATFGYTMIDKDKHSFKRDTSVPITALFKVHAPVPFIKPYAGLGQALIFHNSKATKGSVIGVAGLNLPIGPLFLNAEYRRQFDDKHDFLAGGAGIAF